MNKKKLRLIHFSIVTIIFLFLSYMWLHYSTPIKTINFAVRGEWITQPFRHSQAGMAFDQPTIGKFFLGSSLMIYFGCNMLMLLQGITKSFNIKTHKIIDSFSKLIIILFAVEFLAPTLILAQYILSLGFTVKRSLGVFLCVAMWFSLLSSLFYKRKMKTTPLKWTHNPILWVCLCSAAALSYSPLRGIISLWAWKKWPFQSLISVAVWLVFIMPLILTAWLTNEIMTNEANKDSGADA